VEGDADFCNGSPRVPFSSTDDYSDMTDTETAAGNIPPDGS
jgi:hypothetical protein